MRQPLSITAIVVALLVSCSSTQVDPVFQLAAPSDRDVPQYHVLVVDGKVLVVTWNNNVPELPQEYQRDTLTLKIEKGYLIDKVWYGKYDNDLIIVYSTSNFDDSGSYIARINLAQRIPVWTTSLAAFNLGEPAIRGQYLYVTSIGFVGKLDLTTGEYGWKHNGLYDRQTHDFNDFQRPTFNDSQVIFQGNNHSNNAPKRIEIDDATGEIAGTFTTDKNLADATQVTPTILATSCPPTHLGAGKNLTVKLQKGCYYRFELPCTDCQWSKDNIVIHYTGDEFTTVVPEGSVWQSNDKAGLGKLCPADTNGPFNLPWFLILPGVENLMPCG